MVRTLADYVIRHHYPDCDPDHEGETGQGTSSEPSSSSPPSANGSSSGNKYALLLQAVAERTGRLVAEWHRVGFVHGVLNTDNMSIVGDTIGESF